MCDHRPEEPVTLSPLSALALAAGILAFGILSGSYLREKDMKLSCDLKHRVILKGELYACKGLRVEVLPAKKK